MFGLCMVIAAWSDDLLVTSMSLSKEQMLLKRHLQSCFIDGVIMPRNWVIGREEII